jgi:hypothetical protein
MHWTEATHFQCANIRGRVQAVLLRDPCRPAGTGLDGAVREVTDKLAAKEGEFIPWGAQELAELLRVQPPVVDDFFGRPWVELFCGRNAAPGVVASAPHNLHPLRAERRSMATSEMTWKDEYAPRPAPSATVASCGTMVDILSR